MPLFREGTAGMCWGLQEQHQAVVSAVLCPSMCSASSLIFEHFQPWWLHPFPVESLWRCFLLLLPRWLPSNLFFFSHEGSTSHLHGFEREKLRGRILLPLPCTELVVLAGSMQDSIPSSWRNGPSWGGRTPICREETAKELWAPGWQPKCCQGILDTIFAAFGMFKIAPVSLTGTWVKPGCSVSCLQAEIRLQRLLSLTISSSGALWKFCGWIQIKTWVLSLPFA